jgi:hypothetical protein
VPQTCRDTGDCAPGSFCRVTNCGGPGNPPENRCLPLCTA